MYKQTDKFVSLFFAHSIGVVEKGWANVQLSVRGVQGHSSTPPKESAVGILAHGMAKLGTIHKLRFEDFWSIC